MFLFLNGCNEIYEYSFVHVISLVSFPNSIEVSFSNSDMLNMIYRNLLLFVLHLSRVKFEFIWASSDSSE